MQLQSAGSNQPASASPGDPAFPSPSSHRLAWWGLVLGDVVGLYCNICGLWFWLVLGFHKLVVINMWMMMNMWLVVVIYCDLWFTIMVVIYCEKMGSVWYIYVYIWNACVDGMQKTKKKFKFLPLCRGQWPRPSAKKCPLPRAQAIALGKDFLEKILSISLPRARE